MKKAKVTKKGKKRAQKQLARRMRATALQKAETMVPVVDGALRDSLQVVDGPDYSVILGSDLDYAQLVEQGTVNQEPQPYIVPAVRRMK